MAADAAPFSAAGLAAAPWRARARRAGARTGDWARTLKAREQLLSASLFVAELLATLSRENRALSEADPLLDVVSLVAPAGSLAAECKQVLELGYLRGADLWHLATALFVAGSHRDQLLFISLDERQRGQAKKLGFATWPKT